MKRVFCNLLALHPNELKKVFYFIALSYLWSVAASLGQRSSDIIFLVKVGSDALPAVYVQTSLAIILFSGALLYGYHHLSGSSVFFIITLMGIALYSFIMIYLSVVHSPSKLIWYFARIFSSLFLYTMITTFWSFINFYFQISEAKRLFGLFTSIVFLGGATSGFILKTGYFNIHGIICIVVLLLIPAIFMILFLSKSNDKIEEHEHDNEDLIAKCNNSSLLAMIKNIFSSRFATLIITAHFFAFFLWVLAEYNYMTAFENRFLTKSHPHITDMSNSEITIFMGKCISVIGTINLFFGIFIYSRVIKYFGVGTAILFTPILYLIAFSGWIFNNSLFFPVMGFFIVEGTAEITDDSNFNLLIKTMPHRLNSFLRVIVDMIFEPLGMLIGGLALYIPNLNSKILGLIVASLALTVAYTIKRFFCNKNVHLKCAPIQSVKKFVVEV